MDPSSSSLRWRILRQALIHRSDSQSQAEIKRVSRKATQGFDLIPCQVVDSSEDSREACVCYTIPVPASPKLCLTQRVDNCSDLNDFEISNRHNIDNTGLVCQWPTEEVVAYFCMSQPEDRFRGKRVIELGSGYGLAGLAIAATTKASEVVISDGNPQVVNYIKRNIESNSMAFSNTSVKAMELHWNQHDELSELTNMFDIIVASDCTFFKEFHKDLASIIKLLLKAKEPSEALFFSPKRGDSLDKFLKEVEGIGLHYVLTEKYDGEVWKRHETLVKGDESWPNYDKNHCYPLLIQITNYR